MNLQLSARAMARRIQAGEISSVELVKAHIEQIGKINPALNAVTELLSESALEAAKAADEYLAQGKACGPLHGVPFSIKDSIDVAGTRCTAGTLGRKNAPPAREDATLVNRLRHAGAIPLCKTNLPDLLFAYESDNLIYGRTNNPYDLERTPGGSSGGESALIAACGSPLGLGSDAAGSVRLPAHFCGITSIKPTTGRLPRTGHVPPAGGWVAEVWQIGPMARSVEDLKLAMELLAGEDSLDFTAPPVPLDQPPDLRHLRLAFFTNNGFARCTPETEKAVRTAARYLADCGIIVEEAIPPGVADAYELERALLGADGGEGIDAYMQTIGSSERHPLLQNGFLARMRTHRATMSQFASRWAQWDQYRTDLARFFQRYDAVLSPVYTQPALKHGESVKSGNFEGFSYTMAWNVAGAPAAVVRCAEENGLPINVQVITKPWRDMLALEVCGELEKGFGGWKPSGLMA
jgi:amidase